MGRCSKCGAENQGEPRFCGHCGSKYVAVAAPVNAGEDGLYYCWKHKKETTRVTCGRCEKPICPQCMIPGPAGVRCRECAKNKTPFRARGMMHAAGTTVTSNLNCRTVWYIYLWSMVLRLIASLFGRF